MAPQGAGQPKLFLDQRRNQYFYHDERTDEYVYQDGTRVSVQRPSATPRTTSASSSNRQTPATQFTYSGSPPRETIYAHVRHGQPLPPQERQGAQLGVKSLDAAMNNMAIGGSSSRTYELGGIQVVEVQNPQSLVRTRYGTSPANRITDPALYNSGVRAHRMLYGTDRNETETLYSNYRMRKHDFFSKGRVFLILWVEPAGEAAGSVITTEEPSDQAITIGAFNERVFSKVRRFVIIRDGENYCSALPIATYGGKGVGKRGVKKSEHAIIYTNREPPGPKTHENPQRGEAGMRPTPIKVTPDEPTEALDPMSRIDFGKVHTIQHNIKVRPFGNVHPSSMAALEAQFASVWSNTPAPASASGGEKSSYPVARASSSSATGAKMRAAASASSQRRRYTTNPESVPEESQESEGEAEGAQDDENDDYDDDDDNDDNFSSSQRSYQSKGKASRLMPRGRAPSNAGVQQTPGSSSTGTNQAAWTARAQWARNRVSQLIQQGNTRQAAFSQLVAQIRSQGRTPEAAHAEAQALLTGSWPSH